ncbi:MAG: Haloacid dehalogenase domain protein hydrolase [Clostridia bacterium]|nr:Haloacid dehalogenase domain protein hydrolase [Clostridia bacterium]
MLNTIIFDLDGTLLPLDMDHFMHIYFKEMGIAFQDMIEPKRLVDNVWNATNVMVNNIEYRTNEDVFMEKFQTLIDGDLDTYLQRFDEFYDKGFLKTRSAVSHMPLIVEAVELLKQKGYQTVLATNPLFPRKAIIHRLKWAGFQEEDFSYITCYENNHYCKPQIQFYEEVLQEAGKSAVECMMVGNDVEEDMVAGKLGMQTYLITNHIIKRSTEDICCTYQGGYEDFLRFAQEIKSLK